MPLVRRRTEPAGSHLGSVFRTHNRAQTDEYIAQERRENVNMCVCMCVKVGLVASRLLLSAYIHVDIAVDIAL